MPSLNFDDIRRRLAGSRGAEMWRSLEELADTDEFREWLRYEFPAGADVWLDGLSRRGFLKFAAAAAAVAGLTGCAQQPLETIVPYVVKPSDRVQGVSKWYATAIPFRGYAIGVLARQFEGRPVKLEGNPDHPASLGATNAFAQAEILGLYDPDRAQVVRRAMAIGTWDDFNAEIVTAMSRVRGLRILTPTVTSPTLTAQINALLASFPGSKWYRYEPVNRDAVYAGTALAFGRPLEPRYHFDRADIVLALDSDFMIDEPGAVRYAHDFIARRRVSDPGTATMNRLYAIEPMPTVTGSMADHRLPRRASDVAQYAQAIAASGEQRAVSGDAGWINAVARDLAAHRGAALVIAGDAQPPEVHAAAHAMTSALGGNTITYATPVANPASQTESIKELANEMASGAVDVLLIIGGNPVYDAPPELDFAQLMRRVPMSIHLSLYEDETSAAARWHLPMSHALESWSDLRAFDGTATIVQPLIAPLYDTRSAHEIVAEIAGIPMRGHDIVKGYWRTVPLAQAGGNFDAWWQATLARGVVAGTTAPNEPASVTGSWSTGISSTGLWSTGFSRSLSPPNPPAEAGAPSPSIEVTFRPDPTIWDGRYANYGWLQELPKPVTKLVWGNAAMVGPQLAERLHLDNEQTIEIDAGNRRIEAPVWIVPGHADSAITLHLGYGRALPNQTADGHGFNAGALRLGNAPFLAAAVRRTGNKRNLTSTQHHNTLAGRDHLRAATLDDFRKHPDFAKEPDKEPKPGETMYPPWPYGKNAWGMAIDLNSCIGCNACVIACVAENNIPVVGQEQVEMGREMQWLHIDRYFAGALENPSIYHQPRPCMHCENAPCEVVCPVGATVHSSEGLNEMIYNRCIGTRYCSNNCPYKVRRFNFLRYAPRGNEVLDLMFNPDVTVRARGVMEKCTYCVQRIEHARIRAQNENRPIREGEIVTACQQACPTQA
ncbi:MAG TPA: TAT-variant-translocated molybdopterin oxidoreductase, partial [Thermoanaerobaculia bacterium]|nr:TAT-variant-translocated molybdopterin oxidoreductase [Thermoanaerobaculia bacterium]